MIFLQLGFNLQVIILELFRTSILLPYIQSQTALFLFWGVPGKAVLSASELTYHFYLSNYLSTSAVERFF